MERPDVKFERSKGKWAGSISMLVLSIPLFVFFYPWSWSGFNNGNKGLIYIVCAALALFLVGFYQTFLTPYALQFQEGGFLLIKSLLFSKALVLEDLESVRLSQTRNRDGSMVTLYTLRLHSGDFYEVPSLTHMAGFIEKLSMVYPNVAIQDDRMRKDQF